MWPCSHPIAHSREAAHGLEGTRRKTRRFSAGLDTALQLYRPVADDVCGATGFHLFFDHQKATAVWRNVLVFPAGVFPVAVSTLRAGITVSVSYALEL